MTDYVEGIEDDMMIENSKSNEIFEYQIYEQAIDWVMEAGRMIKQAMDIDIISIKMKANHTDLVTVIDQQVESWLVENINVSYPSHAILGEENVNNRTSASEYVWIIDPVDGTTNMINRNQDFAISLALCTSKEAVFGIVYNVMSDQFFCAFKGKGAFLNKHRLSMLSTQSKLENELIAITLPWSNVDNFEEWSPYLLLASKARGIRVYGATTIELCDIALNKLGVYLNHQVKSWDYAASRVILEELGCKFTDLQGQDISWIYNGGVLATRPGMLREVLDTLELIQQAK